MLFYGNKLLYFSMIEYVFVAVFAGLFLRPMKMTLVQKVIQLAMIVYVSYKQPLLGILCAMVFIRQLPVEGMVVHKKKPTRMALDEQVRPKDSNVIRTVKSGGLPPDTALTGHVAKPFVENHSGNYTPF